MSLGAGDGFGEGDVASFGPWLRNLVTWMVGRAHPDWDDYVQEGFVGMYLAASKFDPLSGIPRDVWLKGAARTHVRKCLSQRLWTGQPREVGRGSRSSSLRGPDGQTVSLLSFVHTDEGVWSMLEAAELVEGIELAYHRGEIFEAIASLSERQQRYVVARFWCASGGLSRIESEFMREQTGVKDPHHLWTKRGIGARDRLRRSLAHLAAV